MRQIEWAVIELIKALFKTLLLAGHGVSGRKLNVTLKPIWKPG